MATCTLPPKGWTCSRKPGHEGPCAASREPFPYDEYVNKVLEKLTPTLTIRGVGRPALGIPDKLEFHYALGEDFLSGLLADAWLAGLGYSLNLVEGEKERRG